MSEFDTLTDNELIAAFHAGDEAGFTRVYDRYGDRIYSYVLNLTESEEIAATASLETFRHLAEGMEESGDAQHLRTRLFSLARAQVKTSANGAVPGREAHDADGRRREVLDAIEDLGARDRHLMLLHLVEGLEGEDLATVMGIEPEALDGLVSRMRRRVEGALGALLIARLGNPGCDEVDGVLGDWGDEYDARLRARLNRHIGGCRRCQERRALLLSPLAALPGIMLVPAPPELRARVRAGVAAALRPDPDEETGVESEGTVLADADADADAAAEAAAVPVPAMPRPEASTVDSASSTRVAAAGDDGTRDPLKLVVFMVVTIVIGLIGFSVAGRFGPLEVPQREIETPIVAPTTTIVPSEETTTTASDTEASTTTPTNPATPPEIDVRTESIDFGEEATSAEFEVTNSGGSAGDITISTSSDAIALSAGEASLAPGETATFQVSLNREQIEEGDIVETITVAWDGGDSQIAAVGTHNDNPTIHSPQASPPEVVVDGGAACIATQTTVSARIRDTSPLESVVARWNDGSNARETAMTDVGGDVYEGVIGPFGSPQTADVRVVAFDDRGNAGGATVSVNVLPCP